MKIKTNIRAGAGTSSTSVKAGGVSKPIWANRCAGATGGGINAVAIGLV